MIHIFLVVTYDVNTEDPAGAKRLRKVAKICERRGVRVQNSVFEVLVSPSELLEFKNEIKQVIDCNKDSVRFYRLGKSYEKKIATMGRQKRIQTGESLMF